MIFETFVLTLINEFFKFHFIFYPRLADNVPRLYEVFAERSGAKIWVERSGTI